MGSMLERDLQNVVSPEVAVLSSSRANAKGLICQEHMLGMPVCFAVNCYCGDACNSQCADAESQLLLSSYGLHWLAPYQVVLQYA